MNTSHFDVHQHITNQITSAIEAGAGDFKLPWHRPSADLVSPKNIASKAAYRGVNILSLWLSAETKGFTSGIWGSFNQWASLGATVRKGEKATYVVFYKEISASAADENDERETRLIARATPVFAAEQVDGYELDRALPKTATEFKGSKIIDAFVGGTRAMIFMAEITPITSRRLTAFIFLTGRILSRQRRLLLKKAIIPRFFMSSFIFLA